LASHAFSAWLSLSVRHHEEHAAVKIECRGADVVISLEQGANDLHVTADAAASP